MRPDAAMHAVGLNAHPADVHVLVFLFPGGRRQDGAVRAALGICATLGATLNNALRVVLDAALGIALRAALDAALSAALRVALGPALDTAVRAALGICAALGATLNNALRVVLDAALGIALRATLGANSGVALRAALGPALDTALRAAPGICATLGATLKNALRVALDTALRVALGAALSIALRATQESALTAPLGLHLNPHLGSTTQFRALSLGAAHADYRYQCCATDECRDGFGFEFHKTPFHVVRGCPGIFVDAASGKCHSLGSVSSGRGESS
ncbi:MAG: hypothetical protein JXJ30_00470 [Halothiobacillaceae bacterium]|nr:hypothetical protein [Halothiobacillaceae bacterium]HER20146.1 hypothetical protein [Chromatiales bacterium]